MRARRLALSECERQTLSARASSCVMRTPEWRDANVVALYMAVRGEADCGLLLVDAWQKEKTVLLPRCQAEIPGVMTLVSCSGPDKLRPGVFSIPEPVADPCPAAVPLAVPDIVVVPGLAFDRSGNRLGMGGGYYDRLLAMPEYAGSLRIGFAYSFQVLPVLPTGAHDMPVHIVCTEQTILRIKTP